MKICPNCKHESNSANRNDGWAGKGRWCECGICGYPLDKTAMLKRIYSQIEHVKEVVTISHFIAPPTAYKKLEASQAIAILDEYEWATFPEYDGKNVIIISIENDSFIFNFGMHEELACFLAGRWRRW